MKKSIALLVAAVMLLCGAGTAQAGLKFGPRIGINVNKLHFDSKSFETSNRCGFTGGLQMEYMSFLNLGLDASLMYSYMDSEAGNLDMSKHFIEIPVNVKYKIGIPVVSNIFAPYIFTGPSVAFRLDKIQNSPLNTQVTQWTWNFGLGLEFINHLQIGASYGLGMNNYVDGLNTPIGNITTGQLKAKNNYWTITAAWLF